MVNPSWDIFQSNIKKENFETPISQDEKKISKEKPNWGNFQDPLTYQDKSESQDEGWFDYLSRNFIANASRVAEQVAGRYGNIEKFATDALVNVPQTGGIIGWAVSQLVGPKNWEKMIRGRGQMLPTSEDLKKASQEITGDYTKPKTKGEERFQEKIEDIASSVTGRTIRNPTIRNITLNNLLTPSAAGVTKDIIKDLGFGEEKANLAKMAVWLPLSLAFNVNANQYATNLMNSGRDGFNQNLQINVPRYENQLNRVARNMLQGDPGSALAQQQIAGIRNDMANGQTNIRNLLTRYDAINRAKRSRDLFALNREDRRAAIRNINEVRDVVRGEIEHLGRNNPQALRDWQNGVQAWSTIHRSNAIRNWVESIAKGPYAKIMAGPALGLFGISSLGAIKAPIIAAPLAVASSASYKTGQTLYRMWNDQNLANYYWNAISAAQRENLPAFLSNYVKLNKKIEKSSTVKPEKKPKK